MENIRIYLDNCCYNRPYDNQSSIKIRIETEAKLFIQNLVLEKKLDLVWSYVLEFENEANPFIIRKNEIRIWKNISKLITEPSLDIVILAENLQNLNIRSKDALHISCAIKSKASYFITTDSILVKKSKDIKEIQIINPLHFIEIFEEFQK